MNHEDQPWMAPGLTEDERWTLFMSRPADEHSFPARVVKHESGVTQIAVSIADSPRLTKERL